MRGMVYRVTRYLRRRWYVGDLAEEVVEYVHWKKSKKILDIFEKFKLFVPLIFCNFRWIICSPARSHPLRLLLNACFCDYKIMYNEAYLHKPTTISHCQSMHARSEPHYSTSFWSYPQCSNAF